MYLTNLLAALALVAVPITANPVASDALESIETRAANKPFTLEIRGNKKQLGGLYKLPIDGGYTGKRKSPLVAATGTAHPTGTEFTLSKGSLHWKVYKKAYSTENIIYGEPIVGYLGNGENDYLAINKTSGYLSFKPEPMGSDQYDFRICKLKSSPGVVDYAVALGDVGNRKCLQAFLKAVY